MRYGTFGLEHKLMTIRTLETETTTRFERRKEEILRAACILFNRNGLRDTTLAVVAAEIGLNLKSLRYYFEKREDLVSAAFLESIRLHQELAEEALSVEPFDQRIRHFVRSYFLLQAKVRKGERPEFVHFGDLRALTEPHRTIVGAAYVDMFRQLRRLFKSSELSWSGAARSANAHLLLSQLLWSVIWIEGYVPEDFPRVADRMSDILINGLTTETIDVSGLSLGIATPFIDSDRLSQETFLRTATHLINEVGYRGASVDSITESLGVTKGAFYHHNETRDGLVLACFERTFGIVRQAQDLAMSHKMDGLARLVAATAALINRQLSPEGALLRTSALTAIGPQLREEMERRLAVLTWRFSDMINDAMIDSSVRVCDIRIASEMVTAAINAAQELQRWVRDVDATNAADLYIRPLFEGFMVSRSA